MRFRNFAFRLGAGWFVAVISPCAAGEPVSAPQRNAVAIDLKDWVVEQMPGGTVAVRDGALVVEDAEGCTVWWREKLTAPVEITYYVTVVSAGGPHDRVSDLNCFWMARDAGSSAAPFARRPARTGKFSDYDSLETYYVGCGGNENSTTRFRRDQTARQRARCFRRTTCARSVTSSSRTARIASGSWRGTGRAEYYRDGERFFSLCPSATATGRVVCHSHRPQPPRHSKFHHSPANTVTPEPMQFLTANRR